MKHDVELEGFELTVVYVSDPDEGIFYIEQVFYKGEDITKLLGDSRIDDIEKIMRDEKDNYW